jgi:hypothetical protein
LARKNLIYSYPFFSAATISSTQTSASSKVDQLDYASISIVWAASTLAATVSVEVKNGDNDSWHALDFSSAITISGASGAHQLVLSELPFTDLRLKITVSSGSGTVDAVITAKSKGA